LTEEDAENKGEVGSGCPRTTGLVASYNYLFVKGSDIRCMDPVYVSCMEGDTCSSTQFYF